jgi:O-succinylbenzoic acid--CoA ligase
LFAHEIHCWKNDAGRSFILGLDIDFVAPSSHPLTKNETKYDFAAMVPLQVENSLTGLKNIKN